MKPFFSILPAFIAIVLFTPFAQAAPITARRDTVDRYVINNTPINCFDGSQLVGKKILSYNISTSTSGRIVINTHTIETDGAAKPASPAIVIDGRQSTQEEYAKLDPSTIKNVSVVKNVRQEEYKKYVGWENGVILIQTKKGE